MGILATNLKLDDSGVCIARAYVALARNEVRMFPQGDGHFFVHTAFDIWNSHADRLRDKRPLETRVLRYDYSGASMPASLYDVGYDHIKAIFPGSTDMP